MTKPGALIQICPIFAVSDLREALAHYSSLGFTVRPWAEGDDYGFAERQGVSLHLSASRNVDHQHVGSAYLYVDDADALYAEWSLPGIAGKTVAPRDTEWRMREGGHMDLDGNLIRFGHHLPLRPA